MFVRASKYRELEKRYSSLKAEHFGIVTKLIDKNFSFPILNKTESEALGEALYMFYTHKAPHRQKKMSPNEIRALSSLIRKGYLIRHKRGEYRLTFVKYD